MLDGRRSAPVGLALDDAFKRVAQARTLADASVVAVADDLEEVPAEALAPRLDGGPRSYDLAGAPSARIVT
jgi:hypothetical protein